MIQLAVLPDFNNGWGHGGALDTGGGLCQLPWFV